MRDLWPMGCKKIKREDELEKILADPNYIGQEKIKGIRAIMHIDSIGKLHFTTRGATLENPDKPIDITHRMSHIADKFIFPRLSNSEFDCELWDPDLDDAEIAGKLNYRSTVEVPTTIRPYIFDVTALKGVNLENYVLRKRLEYLSKLSRSTVTAVSFLPYFEGENKEVTLNRLLQQGMEGMVFKNLNSKYVQGKKKAGHWYKYKKKDTVDAVITGSTPPEHFYRNRETGVYEMGRETKPWANGWIGSLNFVLEDGNTGSCSGMSDALKSFFSDGKHQVRPEFIGRTIEVEFFEKNKQGNLEHPRFIRLREEEEK